MLLYRLPGFTVLSACGAADGVAAFAASDYPLPERPFLMVRPGDLAALDRRYQCEALDHMLRMVLNASDLRSESVAEIETVALTMDDLPALAALYGTETETETAFSPEMLQHGIFYGVFKGGELVAAAGTHTIARRRAIGVIGSVLTRPDYRGRGLATATTGAVAWALARAGIRVLALNVRADNAPALAIYRRLGFSARQEFYEGFATLRTLR